MKETMMAQDTPCYVAFWPDRFLGGVQDMTTQEIGAYILLLCKQVQDGYIPNNTRRLAAIARMDTGTFEAVWKEVLGSKFEPVSPDDPTRLVNRRMAIERSEAVDRAELASARGRKAANARWNAQAMPKQCPSNATQTQTQKYPSGTKGPALKRVLQETEFAVLRDDAVEAALAWSEYQKRMRIPYWKDFTWRNRLRQAAQDPDTFVASVRHSMDNEYKGLFAPKATGTRVNNADPLAADDPQGLRWLDPEYRERYGHLQIDGGDQ